MTFVTEIHIYTFGEKSYASYGLGLLSTFLFVLFLVNVCLCIE